MEKDKEKKLAPLEEGILMAAHAIDNQVAREMQRDPKALAEHGVQKWEPYQERIERLTAFLLENFADGEVELDSLLVLAQTFSKTLSLLVEDIGTENLGKLRSTYCSVAAQYIAEDARKIKNELNLEKESNLN